MSRTPVGAVLLAAIALVWPLEDLAMLSSANAAVATDFSAQARRGQRPGAQPTSRRASSSPSGCSSARRASSPSAGCSPAGGPSAAPWSLGSSPALHMASGWRDCGWRRARFPGGRCCGMGRSSTESRSVLVLHRLDAAIGLLGYLPVGLTPAIENRMARSPAPFCISTALRVSAAVCVDVVRKLVVDDVASERLSWRCKGRGVIRCLTSIGAQDGEGEISAQRRSSMRCRHQSDFVVGRWQQVRGWAGVRLGYIKLPSQTNSVSADLSVPRCGHFITLFRG